MVGAASVAEARRWAVHTVEAAGHPGVAPVVALLVSELASNVLLHAGGDEFTVEITDGAATPGAAITVGVCDASRRLPQAQSFTLAEPGGRGLAIVEALADDWGADPRRAGKCVWFRLLTAGRGLAVPSPVAS